jgi:hypothetical protein
MTRWWVAGTSAALLSLNTAQARTVPYEMVVRIYNTAGLQGGDVGGGQRVAERIFHRAGIRMQWRQCVPPGGHGADRGDVCMEPLQPREVIGRVVAGARYRPGVVFGYALVDNGAHTGTMATIFADRISAAASRVSINGATLLGRTLAHELGHLLLGTNSHAPHGLMRGSWPDALMRSDIGRDWQFSNGEARQMRQALGARAGGALQAEAAGRSTDPS